MKRTIMIALVLMIGTTMVFAYGPRAGATDNNGTPGARWTADGWNAESHATVLESLPIEDLSLAEQEALEFMIEEEKLARDVYTALYEKWNLRTFANIAESEQQHMDSVASLLERYDIAIPATVDKPGEFNNQELQALYEDLTEQGTASMEGALTVGATIEDVDIADLERLLDEEIDNQDITMIYENLIKGSENHMRAFVGQLERFGGSYEPQYLSEDRYGEIVAADAGANADAAGFGRGAAGFGPGVAGSDQRPAVSGRSGRAVADAGTAGRGQTRGSWGRADDSWGRGQSSRGNGRSTRRWN